MGGQKQNGLLILLLLIVTFGRVGITVVVRPLTVKAQVEPTATPDADGVIYSEVRPNDSLWAVAARAGITLPELLELNDLSESDIIQPGQLLIVGYGTPAATVTMEAAAATATSTPPPPTATAEPPPPTGICLVAFTDTNGDGRRDAGEPLKASVAFTIFNEQAVVANYVTDGVSEPYCLEGMAAGDYQVTRSIGSGETLTGGGDRGVIVTEGNVIHLEFGSYSGPVPPIEETAIRSDTNSALQATPANQVTPAQQAGPAGILFNPFGVTLVVAAGLFVAGAFLFLARKRRHQR